MATSKSTFSQQYCCFHHKEGEPSSLGIFTIPADVEGKPVLELLGNEVSLDDQELQDKMQKHHPYIFNLGGGKYFENYHEAEDELLKRNFEAIVKDQQDRAIFLPEIYILKVPRAVNVEEYESRKDMLDDKSHFNQHTITMK